MTRVLILCEYGSLNGGERSLLSVLDGLCECGFECLVTGPVAGALAEAVAAEGATYVPIRLHDDRGRRLELSICRQRLRSVISKSRVQLVHANSLSTSRLAGPVTADLGLASVGHLRDIINVSTAVISDMNRHTRLLAVSQATRRHWADAGLEAAKTHVCYNGVDLQRFQPRQSDGSLHAELGVPAVCPLVGTIGQIGMRKGLHLLAEAAERVVAAIPDAHFVVVGGRYSQKEEAFEYERQLLRRTSARPLAGHFHFLGVRDDVHHLLNEFTILAHAARQEPLGRVLLEAAACGTPVVATDVGGTSEIFPPATSSALLVPPDDAQAMAEAMIALLENEGLRREIGTAAQQRITLAFDARQSAEALAAHYRETLRWH
jgi:glycosyltransferase involved in cell wall biosynthesis